MNTITELYAKKKAALRYRLHGMKFFDALKALNLAESVHPGFRKDGVTPSFMHQVEIALYVLTLMPHLIHQERTIIAALLHDTPEDTAISHAEIREKFGWETYVDVELLTKEYRGEKKTTDQYFGPLGDSCVSSIVKGCDRINNISTMAGVFSLQKQIAYVEETEQYFFSFLKTARRNYPEQELAYENIKFVLTNQLKLFNMAHSQGLAL